MTQAYSDPTRADDPHTLPNVEVFYVSKRDIASGNFPLTLSDDDPEPEDFRAGWYYWFCFPGCLPDSDPVGPFASEQEAIAAAQEEDWEDWED